MGILATNADERVKDVRVGEDTLSVDLMDGRTIAAPLAWYPRLASATQAQLENWQLASAGYGIHWPELDEDLSTEGLLRGAPGVVARKPFGTKARTGEPCPESGVWKPHGTSPVTIPIVVGNPMPPYNNESVTWTLVDYA